MQTYSELGLFVFELFSDPEFVCFDLYGVLLLFFEISAFLFCVFCTIEYAKLL